MVAGGIAPCCLSFVLPVLSIVCSQLERSSSTVLANNKIGSFCNLS